MLSHAYVSILETLRFQKNRCGTRLTWYNETNAGGLARRTGRFGTTDPQRGNYAQGSTVMTEIQIIIIPDTITFRVGDKPTLVWRLPLGKYGAYSPERRLRRELFDILRAMERDEIGDSEETIFIP